MQNRTRHPLAVALLVVFILCSGWLAATQSVSGQPTQEPTDIPSRVTPEPTREPTAEPTTAPRPTREPTAEPTTEPIDPIPPVTVSPTEALPPALPPINNSGQGPNELDENAVGSGHVIVKVRLCPPEFDLTQRLTSGTLSSQCRGLAWETNIGVVDPDQGPPLPWQYADVHQAEIASFTTSATTQVVRVNTSWFEPVAITCVLPSDSPAVANTNPVLMPTIGSSGIAAEVPVLELKTTACTWYLHHPELLAEVTVHLWSCPAGYDLTSVGSDPSTDCIQSVDGEYVSISTLGSSVNGVTGTTAPGMITFTSIPPGEYSLYYVNPLVDFYVEAGWDYLGACGGDPVVSVEDDNFPNQAGMSATVPSGGAIDCSFYRVPPA